MAFDVTSTLAAVTSFLKTQPGIRNVQVGMPETPPTDRLGAAVTMVGIETPATVLDAPINIYEVQVRLYREFTSTGTETENEIAKAVSTLFAAIHGDLDLGATVRNVDVAGQYSGGMSARWSDADVGGRNYRTCDILLPIIVDGAPASYAL